MKAIAAAAAAILAGLGLLGAAPAHATNPAPIPPGVTISPAGARWVTAYGQSVVCGHLAADPTPQTVLLLMQSLYDNMATQQDMAAILVMSVDDYCVRYRPLLTQMARAKVTPDGVDVPRV